MSPLNSKNGIDNSSGIGQDNPNEAMNATDQSKKSPWRLRFAGTILAVAGLLLAPLPSGKVQAQCAEFDPNDCAHPCYVPRPDYSNDEFHDAASREDCDRILQKVLEDIEKRWKEIKAAGEAVIACDTDYADDLKRNDLQHKLDIANAINAAKGLFWSCMGFGGTGAVGGSMAGTYRWAVKNITTGAVTVARVGSGIATYKICKDTRDDTAQSYIDTANQAKAHADKVALTKRDRCRETTNYDAAFREHFLWSEMYNTDRVYRRGRLILSM